MDQPEDPSVDEYYGLLTETSNMLYCCDFRMQRLPYLQGKHLVVFIPWRRRRLPRRSTIYIIINLLQSQKYYTNLRTVIHKHEILCICNVP